MPSLDLLGEREITNYMRRAFGDRARIERVATSPPHVSSRGAGLSFLPEPAA